jgi:phage major head subunit gpT-like protein
MALITTATIAALQTSFSTVFRQAYADSDVWWQNVAMLIPSNTDTATYGWMARILSMREWLGPRLLQNLRNHEYTLRNRTYEATIAVGREEIEDDMLGLYNVRLQELARSGAKLPDQLLRATLQAGVTELGFDGVAHFAATHDLDPGGNQSNNITTNALDATNYDSSRAAMMGLLGEDGEPLGVMPNLLVVPPQLETTAKTIVNASLTAAFDGTNASQTNVLAGTADVLMLPELANEATTWYLMDTRRAMKPFIWQQRRPISLVSKTAPTDDGVFFQNQFVWGIDGRGATGYGPWWLSQRNIA